jgi:hypothetical protein
MIVWNSCHNRYIGRAVAGGREISAYIVISGRAQKSKNFHFLLKNFNALYIS